jgi:MFS family permease
MYSLFRNEKTLDEKTVATLYISTYVAAAVSAFFTGYLTDRFGRRKACLAFCAIHSLATVSVCFNNLAILILGRVLGGVALTLLWAAFESWMITEYNERGFAQSSLSLSSVFGIMTTSKCITAIFAGVLGHCVVLALGSKTHPFILGAVRRFPMA